ncbi:hypothetical protein HBB16_21065 [Pseudonocardia sp. MCCB 268]|nr:hypothetical protein [Pseudonocardia cytotoxica]
MVPPAPVRPRRVRPGRLRGRNERAARPPELVAAGAPMIWGAVPPAGPVTAGALPSCAGPAPGGGYVPLLVVRRRITDPGEGARTTAVTDPWLQRAPARP